MTWTWSWELTPQAIALFAVLVMALAIWGSVELADWLFEWNERRRKARMGAKLPANDVPLPAVARALIEEIERSKADQIAEIVDAFQRSRTEEIAMIEDFFRRSSLAR